MAERQLGRSLPLRPQKKSDTDQLQQRVDQLEQQLAALTERVAALENP